MAEVNSPDDEHFDGSEKSLSCSIVLTFPYPERCQQVGIIPACQKVVFFNYVEIIYCVLNPQTLIAEYFSLLPLLLMVAILFTILGTVADRFFCPTLKVFSLIFGMSEHLAGVTLLAFGNGSPDILTSYANLDNADSGSFATMLASGLFVSSFVGGVLCIFYPFSLQMFNLVRDVCFLMLAVMYLEYSVATDSVVTIQEGFYVLIIYISYLTTILLDQYLLTRSLKRMQQMLMHDDSLISGINAKSGMLQSRIERMKSEAHMGLVVSNVSIDKDMTRKQSFNEKSPKNDKLFAQLLEALNPVELEDWQEGKILGRAIVVAKVPLNLLLLIFIPVVDYEKPRHGWFKMLNVVQIVTTPMIICSFIVSSKIYGVPFFLYTLVVTLPTAVVVFFLTRTDLPPRFHALLGVYTIICSVFIIYSSAGEVTNILSIVGMATGASENFLSCSILAWGNSLGDLIANTSMARQGYHKMGFAACIGGPLFNMLMGLGVPFLYTAIKSEAGSVYANQGMLGQNCVTFMVIELTLFLFAVLTTGFDARRSVGIFSFNMYVLFFIYAVLGELEVVKTYAEDQQSGLP